MARWSTVLFLLFISYFLQGNATPLQPRQSSLSFRSKASHRSTSSSIAHGTGTSRVIGTGVVSRTRRSNSTSTAKQPSFSSALKNATSSSRASRIGLSSHGVSLTTKSHSSGSNGTSTSRPTRSSSAHHGTSQTGKPSHSRSQTEKSSSTPHGTSQPGKSSGSHSHTKAGQTGKSSSPASTKSHPSSSKKVSKASSSSSTSPLGTGVLPFPTTSGTQTAGSPASITWSGSWSVSVSEPTTADWPFFLVPTTTIAPAEATHEAFLLADLFFALKANRQWITDPKLKSQYIDNLEKTKDEVFALFNDLDVKPPANPDCSKTKRKRTVISEKEIRAVLNDRSLFSAVTDLAKDVVGLVTCASKVVSNLVDNVKLPVPPIDIIENLTDVLETIGEDIKEDDPDDEKKTNTEPTKSHASTTSSSKSSSSCTGKTTFSVCTQTVSLSTSYFSGATSFTVSTVTSTACATSTATGCHTGTTVTTTASNTASGAGECSPQCTACSWDGPTQVPVPPGQKKRDGQLEQRTIPDPGTDINAFYDKTLRDTSYQYIPVPHRSSGTKSSAVFDDFESTPNYMMVAGLFGCTSITVVSEKGAWMSHHWESPGFGPGTTDADFKKNILGPIQTQEQFKLFGKRPPEYAPASQMPALFPLLAAGQKLGPETHREVFISTPHAIGDPNEYMFKDRMALVIDLLTGAGAPLAGVPLTIRKYDKFIGDDEERDALDYTSRGKVMIQYDNNQVAANGATPQQAMWRVWLEDERHDHTWGATDIQKGSCSLKQKRDGSCSRPSSSAFEGGNGPTSTDTGSSPVSKGPTGTGTKYKPSSTHPAGTDTKSKSSSTRPAGAGTKSEVSSTGKVSVSGKSTKTSSFPISSSKPSKSSSRSPTTISKSTSLPPRVAAPVITIATPSATPDCVQGWQTYTMPARATAPANAASLKFAIPEADLIDSDWEFHIVPSPNNDAGKTVKSYQVGSSATGPPITSGNGGANLTIKWQTPKGTKGTWVELLFTDDPPLGNQTFAVVAYGSGIACMPKACSGPPTITTNDDGLVCKLYPCSTDAECEPGGHVTPEAACQVMEDGAIIPLWYDVTIVANNWITDNGDGLKKQEKGCGDLLSWSVNQINVPSPDGSWVASNAYSFTLPLTISGGCVERAIASAGGPSGLQCVNTESDWVF